MPRRALPLAVAAVVLLAGCSGVVPSGDTTPTETTRERTTSECPPRTDYDRKPLPDVPENVTAERAVAFATAYEKATVWNERVPKATHHLAAETRGEVVTETETGYVVYVQGSASYTRCSDGVTAHGDHSIHTNYFVNESTVVRLTYPKNKTDDPRYNGGAVVENES